MIQILIANLLFALLALPSTADRAEPDALRFARAALEQAIGGEVDWIGAPNGGPAPVFVTVVLDGRTRACQGSLSPMTSRLATEIAAMARRAAQGDGRYPPLRRDELDRARIVLSFPETPRPWDGRPVDPRGWGMVVETPQGAGVLLPGEARTFEWMLAEARRRAGAAAADAGYSRIFRTRTLGEHAAVLPLIEGVAR